MVQLGRHFANKDILREPEGLSRQQWFIKARYDHERREKTQDRLDDDFVALAADIMMATQAQITAFEIKLTKYDEATVHALMENQELLDAVNARIDRMLEQAHVLEDGRRVFRTEDGTQVFDEYGVEVGALEIDPQIIDPTRPSWEAYSAEVETQRDLMAERAELLEFQERLDAAREEIDGGEITEADLEALDAELMDIMPDAVRAQSPDMGTAQTEVAANAPQLGSGLEQVTHAARFPTAPSPLP